MTEKELHKINDHYDRDPRDQEMRAWGWEINGFGEWSMEASSFILRKEKEGFAFLRPLADALKNCLEIDREIKKKGEKNGK